MNDDIFGQPTSLTQPEALAEWNRTQTGFLAHGAATPQHLARVLAAEPGFAQGHALHGICYLLLGRRELVAEARAAHDRARTALAEGDATARERAYVDVLEAWLQGRPALSVQLLERVLRDTPTDTLAMKLSHAIRFVLGDGAGMLRSVERVLPAYAPDHPGRGYLLGCHAFALEENGAYTRAEIAGRQALWLAPDDAWGLHAVAHVHDMTGNAETGLDWLDGREAAWARCNNFRYHVWWHKALMLMDLGRMDAALALYDSDIRADRSDDYRDIANAASLLMRLQLEGVDVGPRWEELAQLSAARSQDGCLIFADLHYLMALTGAGAAEGTAALVARIARDAAAPRCEMTRRMADPGLAAARGLEAFAAGRFASAFAHLEAARPRLQLAGGSHAQRDIFERLTIDAGLRAGHLAEAEAILDQRRARRAGRDDGYARARRSLIAAARRNGADRDPEAARMPAQ